MNAIPETFSTNIFASVCFGAAIWHTFLAKWFRQLASRFRAGSVAENFFHLIGEIEVVFGLWAGLYILGILLLRGGSEANT